MNANELLMGGGVKAAKFETLGDTVIGTIAETPKVQQMKKYQSDELDFWPSGDPKMQIVVTLQTDQRDPSDAQDDGRRNLFIIPRMMGPVREAVQKAGAKGLEIGGRIAVRWVAGTGQGQGNPKQYAAEYAAPAVDPGGLLNGGGNGNGHVQAAAPVSPAPMQALGQPPAAPVASPVAQSLGINGPATPPAGLPCPPGMDPAKWAALPPAQQQAVAAAMAAPAPF